MFGKQTVIIIEFINTCLGHLNIIPNTTDAHIKYSCCGQKAFDREMQACCIAKNGQPKLLEPNSTCCGHKGMLKVQCNYKTFAYIASST